MHYNNLIRQDVRDSVGMKLSIEVDLRNRQPGIMRTDALGTYIAHLITQAGIPIKISCHA